jgi:hypothetical protein
MSEPKRFNFSATIVHHIGGEKTAALKYHTEPDGLFVSYEDYARLKAEVERYRLASLRVDVGELHAQFNRALFDDTIAENARLKAEVESLYRHGDLMLKFAAANMTFPAYATMAKDWNAAKEGKPRA